MCWGVGGGSRDVERGMKGDVGKFDGVWVLALHFV